MKMHRVFVVLQAVALLPAICQEMPAPAGGPVPGTPPVTRKSPVVDRYHGVEVADDYRWLESWDDPAVKAWSEAQNVYARSVLDRLPGVETLRRQVEAVRKIQIPRYDSLAYAGGELFALKFDPPKQQPVLVVMPSESDPASARVLVDPNQIDPQGTTTVDWYVPSPDGTRVAVSLSEGGSERGDLHVYETATGKEAGEVVHRVHYGTAGGSMAWDSEGRGFFYSRYPRAGERPPADLDFYTQIYYHRLGTPETADRYELGKDFLRIAEISLERSPDGRSILANVEKGDSGEYEQYLRGSDGRWLRLTHFSDRIVQALFGPQESLYLLSRGAGAPRGKILQASLAEIVRRGSLDLDGGRLIVPESDGVIEYDSWLYPETIAVTETRLFVLEGIGGPYRVGIYDLAGKRLGTLPLPPVSNVRQLISIGKQAPDGVMYQTNSYTQPSTWYRWTPADGSAARTVLSVPSPIDFSDVEVVREQAVSKDGTHVPMTILYHKGTKLDGNRPVLMTGYGGFGLSQAPYFNQGLRIWLDHGGVYVYTNLRGGRELGEEWHQGGSLTRKQNVFDDFIACAEHLVRAGYTNPQRLAIEGASNGGLLVGAALTQRPELFKAVVARVGNYDMLRFETDPNGEFNAPELGTVKDPEQFRAMLAYSPYQHVRDGVAYPAILLMTGANDARVNPMQSRKMAARLQAAGARLVLLRTSATSGHGPGTRLDDRIAQEVDSWAFLFDQLQMGAAMDEGGEGR